MQQRLPSLRDYPIAFAHRGARAHAMENTIPAFELALKLGANGLETDVWLTADNKVVIDHDGVHRGRLSKKSIRSVSRTELAAHIPDFVELLRMTPSGVHLSIDVKDLDAVDSVVADARATDFSLRHLWLCHYDIERVLEMKARYPDVRIVDSTSLSKIREGLEMRAALLSRHGIDAINLHVSDWSGGLVTLVHRFGLLAFGWDAQFPPVLQTALLMGLDGIYSDHVDRMVDAYNSVVGRLPDVD